MQLDTEDPRTWPPSALAFLRRREQATIGVRALVELIHGTIRARGPIPFAEYMRLALYHPEHGYYTAPAAPMGRAGDYLTAPETHPAFGALVCRHLARMWENLGRPGRFDVVEGGGGTGALAQQVLGYAAVRRPDLRRAIAYTIVETSPALRDRRREQLGALATGVRWVASLDALPPASVHGCLLSNELLDALPVHRVQGRDGGLEEIYVGLDGERLVDVTGPPSTPTLADYLHWVGATLPDGCQAEIGLEATAWYREAARRMARGYVLTVDYGGTAAERYGRHQPRGTFLCYYRHTANEEPYQRIGTQDITAHVDFTALRQAGEEEGLSTVAYTSQREWLCGLGIADWAEGREDWPDVASSSRDDLAALVDPERLGRLKVLVQSAGLS